MPQRLTSMAADAPSDPPPDILAAWAHQARSVEQVAGVEQIFSAIRADSMQDTVSYAFTTANLLNLLGTRPSHGRMFTREEEKPRANHVAMISHRWWQAAYDGRDDVLGKSLETFQAYQMPVMPLGGTTFVARFASVPAHVESVLRTTIQQVDRTIIVRRTRIADDYLREALAPPRFTLALLGAFAGVSLFLAVVGLYGSIAYAVSQRTREIGIRIALGASANTVTRLVIGDGIRLALAGLIVGVGIAAAASRTLSSLLYSVTASDPATFAAIAALVGVVALVASYVPARRAVRVDPIDALRSE